MNRFACITARVLLALSCLTALPAAAAPGDILFVTQVPIPSDFANVVSTFGNHTGSLQDAPRGGDLFLRYGDGTLRNLTAEAGFGGSGMLTSNAIAVRDPAVHWSGRKALFSMVRGAPEKRYAPASYRWQLYEVSGLSRGEEVRIVKVPGQPESYNNVMPAYGSADEILFVSDRPRNGDARLYPQLDEYESTPTNTGLWKIVPASGELTLLDHAPSGVFHPFVDSFGRVIYTRWDHLQRDQQNLPGNPYGAFNYADEDSGATTASHAESFPEPRGDNERKDQSVNLHRFNHFFPWMINQDGSEHETLNHIGRHELHEYFDRSLNDDPNLKEFIAAVSNRVNRNPLRNLFHIKESPLVPGRYIGVDAPEFETHSAGQIVALDAPPGLPADRIEVEYLTARSTADISSSPPADHSGLYRDPLPLSDGAFVAAHTVETREDRNEGSRNFPSSRYDFRLKRLVQQGSRLTTGAPLTPGIQKTISYWDPDELVSYSGVLWELQPVELVARTRPLAAPIRPDTLNLAAAGTSLEQLREFLLQNDLALIVVRDVTTRDGADRQQPFNLRVFDSAKATLATSGRSYAVAALQILQGELLRGYGGPHSPLPGRRVLARPINSEETFNPAPKGSPAGAVRIAQDGSAAAFVPARRAVSWQLLGPHGDPVVRERYWLTLQPGEIRVCGSCHGINSADQTGASAPRNEPEALAALLKHVRDLPAPRKPAYSISLASRAASAGGSSVRSGSRIRLLLRGRNRRAAHRDLTIQLRVGGSECAGAAAHVTTNNKGKARLRMFIPPLTHGARVTVAAYYQGARVARKKIRVLKAPKRARRSLKIEPAALCGAATFEVRR